MWMGAGVSMDEETTITRWRVKLNGREVYSHVESASCVRFINKELRRLPNDKVTISRFRKW